MLFWTKNLIPEETSEDQVTEVVPLTFCKKQTWELLRPNQVPLKQIEATVAV